MFRMHRRLLFVTREFCSKINKEVTTPSKYNLFAIYFKCLQEKPILTKCITSGVISCCADIICQTQFPEEKKDEKTHRIIKEPIVIDTWRLIKFTAVGTVFVGPLLHYWYGFLGAKFPGNAMFNTVQRLAMDQLFFAPIFMPTFLSVVLILDGKTDEIVHKLKADYVDMMLTNYTVWVPAMFINFKFVPPTLQVLFSNTVGLGWNVYLSNVSHKHDD